MFSKKGSVVMVLMLVLVMAFSMTGCGSNDKDAAKTNDAKDGLSGSFTIAGSTSVQPLSEELTQAFMEKNPNVKIEVQGGGSTAGVKAATDGAAEIGAASRELKDTETGLTTTEIARDGIAVVTNAKGAGIENLTKDQIQKIFSGEIKNWKEIGGKDAKINIVSREEGSGTRGAFTELIMENKGPDGKKVEVDLTKDAAIQSSNGAVRTTVAGDENAVGYLSLGYLDNTVKAVKVENVEATADTVKNGSYKLSRPFLYLTKGEATGAVKAYIDFVMSPEGQKIVGKEYVKVK